MKPLLSSVIVCIGALTLAAQSPPVSTGKLFAVRLTLGPVWDAAVPPSEQKDFASHSANLARLRRAGMLVLGARYGETGLVVLRANDEAAVRAELAHDPTIAGGVFAAEVDEFIPFYHGSTHRLTTPEAVLLRAYLDAFNQHDALQAAALCVKNVRSFSVNGDKITAAARDSGQLFTWLKGYFANHPAVHTDFLSIDQAGSFLTVRDSTSWTDPEGKRINQEAIGVYEIDRERIVRMWYFPGVRNVAR